VWCNGTMYDGVLCNEAWYNLYGVKEHDMVVYVLMNRGTICVV